jgi:hypothetical protein
VKGAQPRADNLLRDNVARPGKLTSEASVSAVGEWRCPHEHLLAAVVPTPHGAWLYWRGSPLPIADGWLCAWRSDLDSPIVRAWCNCRGDVWDVDTLSPRKPPTLSIG